MPTLEWIWKNKVINHHLDVPYWVLDCRYSYVSGGYIARESENNIIKRDNLEVLKALMTKCH
jgi:adenine-specific DNA-methyltransferase